MARSLKKDHLQMQAYEKSRRYERCRRQVCY